MKLSLFPPFFHIFHLIFEFILGKPSYFRSPTQPILHFFCPKIKNKLLTLIHPCMHACSKYLILVVDGACTTTNVIEIEGAYDLTRSRPKASHIYL